jgi:hypothetical protein
VLDYADRQAQATQAALARISAPPVLPSREAMTTIAAGLVSVSVQSTHHSTVTIAAGPDPQAVGQRAKEGIQAALDANNRQVLQDLVDGLRRAGQPDAERFASLISNASR